MGRSLAILVSFFGSQTKAQRPGISHAPTPELLSVRNQMPSSASLQWLEFSRDATLCNSSVTGFLTRYFASNDFNGQRSLVFDGGFSFGAP